MTGSDNHAYVNMPNHVVTLCGWTSYRSEQDVQDGEVTCENCKRLLAAARQLLVAEMLELATEPQTVTLLNFHTDYGNDDACDTPLAIFSYAADAERHRATLTASLQPCERSTLSYNTETMTVLPKGADYTGGPYG